MSLSRYFNTLLCLISSALLLSACAIEDRTSQEVRLDQHSISKFIPTSELDFFEARCLRCIRGDISDLKDLATTYSSSLFRVHGLNQNFKDKHQNKITPFLYQQIRPTLAFERCAQKARLLGDRTGIKHMLVRPHPIIRAARYFYSQDDATAGAFWLQRLVNLKGEDMAYEMAGRSFIRKTKTIAIGVQLLEQSARLGNKESKQILMGLMAPGSLYYQQITNTTHLSEQATDPKQALNLSYERPEFKPSQHGHVPFKVISPTTPEMKENFDEKMQQLHQQHAERLSQVKERAAKAAQEAETRLKGN